MRRRMSERSESRYFLIQAIICVLCTLVGAFYPTLLDWSKTATETSVFVKEGKLITTTRRGYPFSPVSVVLMNDAIQLSIALVVVANQEGLRKLVQDQGLVMKLIPLGAIYAIGELLTLRSVQKGSGPVYVVIANMKLVVAACMSRAFFGREWSMPLLHWLELVLISVAAALYTLAEAGSLGSQWDWEGAWAALAKSSLVAFSSVFCEHTYKSNSFLVVITLQAAWGLVTILFLTSLSMLGVNILSAASELVDEDGAFSFFGGGPAYPLCASVLHTRCVKSLMATASAEVSCTCLSSRGWDVYTLLTVLADLSNAISTALVFKRLSAVAKYICRAASAVPMYLFYCLVGRSSWDLRVFVIVVYLCAQVGHYTVERHKVADAAEKAAWAQHYAAIDKRNQASVEDASAEGLRNRQSQKGPS